MLCCYRVRVNSTWPPKEKELGESPFSASPARGETTCGHIAVPLHCIPGYDGDKQQACAVCGLKTSYCCIICSTKDCVLALHQPFSSVGKPTVYRDRSYPVDATARGMAALGKVGTLAPGAGEGAPHPMMPEMHSRRRLVRV